VVLDCGFDLADPSAGERLHAAGHVPGALHVHLDRDLSGPKTGLNGRHPLPSREQAAALFGSLGVAPGVQVVAYDAQGGPYAARAWWLLRWLGHREVAVLDGGWQAWQAAGGAVETAVHARPGGAPYPMRDAAMPTVATAEVLAGLGRLGLVDARAPERFRGDVEPLDPVAGHIPGARLRFFKDNLGADGCFKPAAQLRAEFEAMALPPDAVVHQCGSGGQVERVVQHPGPARWAGGRLIRAAGDVQQPQWLCPPRPLAPMASTAAMPNASQKTWARVWRAARRFCSCGIRSARAT